MAVSTLAVTVILTLLVVGGRLIKFFGLAAGGRIEIGALLSVIGFQITNFLTLILPLSFFIALMLVFGRLYVDHEMAVLNASGVSRSRLGRMLWPQVIFMILLEAVLILQIGPWGNRQATTLMAEQARRSGFDAVQPGEFVQRGEFTFYADGRTPDGRGLVNIFIHQKSKDGSESVITARQAERRIDPTRNSSVIDLLDGHRYEFRPNTLAHTQAQFGYYRLYLNDTPTPLATTPQEARTTGQLWQERDQPLSRAELGWRLAFPWVPLVALLLALPLSQVNPRQGRYLRLFPALMIFVTLVVALIAVKTRVGKERLTEWAYLFVLLGYGGLGWILSRTGQRRG